MSTIFGVIGIQDRDATLDTVNQRLIVDLVNQYATATEAEVNQAFSVFVQEITPVFKETYRLPGGGMMQRMSNRGRPGAVKLTGKWDVAYPIEDLRDQLAWDDVAFAYMRAGEAEMHIRGVFQRYINSKRYFLLRALLNKTAETFHDDIYGDLTIQRLANGDSVVYPPLVGSDTEATDNHYIGSNYLATAISDTNNPFRDIIRPELQEHNGQGRIVAWINSAQQGVVSALASFDPKPPQYVTVGANTDVASADGTVAGPGKFIGAANDIAIFVWDWVPAGYILALDLDQPAPLKQRVDVPESLRGFKLIATKPDFPLQESFWRAREGYGAANRLNGVAVQLVASTTYSTPAAYA
jgi:hypothetical protein